jgi:hypothetical protein
MIKLELDVKEVQLILGALGNLPYAQVNALVELIVGQAKLQLEKEEKKEVK